MSIYVYTINGSAMETVSLSLFRFDSLAARLWVFTQMGLARPALRRTPDLLAWKLCGTGTGEGFTPLPNFGVYAILATWPSLEAARAGVAGAPVWQRWRARAAEDWTIYLAPTSVRGVWGGTQPFHVSAKPEPGPLVALTRATIRPRVALKFWEKVPDISRVIGMDDHVAFKIGIGEVPLLHQVTFSIWPDASAMADFARADGPHARAIAAVRAGNWFSEELYARFRILDETGTWGGESPLKSLERPAA
jgi:spheroidene monooxygenase